MLGEARFEQQRHVEDGDASAPSRCSERSGDFMQHGGVHDALQVATCSRIAKNHRREALSVEPASRVVDVVAESATNRPRDGCGSMALVRESIGVDHDGPELGEHASHGRLSTGDAGEQTDDDSSAAAHALSHADVLPKRRREVPTGWVWTTSTGWLSRFAEGVIANTEGTRGHGRAGIR
jgi:hypothetical protein